MQILYSYLRYPDKLLDVLFLLLALVLSELQEKPKRKDCVTEKSTQNNLCERHHFLSCTPSFLCDFLSLFLSTSSVYASEVLVGCSL